MSNGSPSVYSSILLPMDLDPSTEGRCKLAVGLADRFAGGVAVVVGDRGDRRAAAPSARRACAG